MYSRLVVMATFGQESVLGVSTSLLIEERFLSAIYVTVLPDKKRTSGHGRILVIEVDLKTEIANRYSKTCSNDILSANVVQQCNEDKN